MDGLSVKVVLADGTEHQFPLRPRVIVAFEQKFGKGMGKLLSEDQRVEHLYYLGWETLKANGIVVPTFGNAFFDTLKTVELISDPNSDSTETR